MKCFYHNNDHDGHCSKEIIRSKFPKCELIGVNYDSPIDPIKLVEENEIVFICDFCFHPFSIMEKLSKKCRLMFLDHHKTSEDEISKSENFKPAKIVIDMKRSACEITWDTIYPGKESNIDVGSIAKEYGGGGHITASSFSCKELPFTLGDDNVL